LYVSDHPLLGVERSLQAAADMPVSQLSDESVLDGAQVTLAGILSGVLRRVTKQGRSWASATLEDLEGAVEVLFFPNTYELVGPYVTEDAIVAVKGRVDRREDVPRLIAADLSLPDLATDLDSKPVVLSLPAARVVPPLVERLKEVLTSHPGSAEVQLRLVNGKRTTVLRLGPLRVQPSTALMADLKALLGPHAVAG
ncbi:MAG: OB-fold nucleic acid binding domain-containing protein, partial [Micromonosporaceae bacterium]